MSILYATTTYTSNESSANYAINLSEGVISIILLAHFMLNLFISDNKLIFLLSWNSFIDCITLIPLLLIRFQVIEEQVFLLFFRAVRVICCLRLQHFFARKNLVVAKRIYKLLFTFLSLVIISGAAILELENIKIPEEQEILDEKLLENKELTETEMRILEADSLTFHDVFYFMIVTLTTVGYGDIWPHSEMSKFIIIISLLWMLAVIPAQTQDIVRVTSLTTVYKRLKYRGGATQKHILLLGDASIDAVETFLNELYHEDHGDHDIHTVILRSEV